MTDKQFLTWMCNKAEALAGAEAELLTALSRSQKYRRREVLACVLVALAVLAVLLAFWLFTDTGTACLIPIAALAMAAALYGDSRQYTARETLQG